MTVFILGTQSREKLVGVHPDLILVCGLAIRQSDLDFTIGEGVRTKARQKILYESGASQTMDSYHLTGDAVDIWALVNGDVRWDWPLYDRLAVTMKAAATELGIEIEWGGDWKQFKDGPHYQRKRR